MISLILNIFAAYCVLLALFYFFQRRLIYFPAYSDITPEQAGVPEMQTVTLTTKDGLTLKAWYAPPQNSRMPTLVYFHGNAGHIGYRASLVKPYLQHGFGVFLLTYRGYSENPGYPSEEGLYLDARGALEYLKGQKVVLYGESIGAAVAIQMALEYPIHGLILQAPFTSLQDVGAYHYPFIPSRLLLKDKYDSLAKAGLVHAPVLILQGENDNIIPKEMAQKLYNALSEPKKLHLIPHTGHNDLYAPTEVLQFLQPL